LGAEKRKEKQELQSVHVLAAILIATMPLPAMAGEVLTQKQISQQIIGKDLTAKRNGVNLRLKYLQDGKVTVKMLVLSFSGIWDFEGNSLCMTMAGGPRKGRNCVTFTALGSHKFLNSEGVTMTVQN
jgi:hypothetical protein